MNSIDLLFACFNQYVFNLAKTNIDSLEYHYQTNIQTSGNPLVSGLLNAIRTYDLSSIGAPLFKSILTRDNKTEAEQTEIFNTIVKYKQYSKEQMEPIKRYIEDISAEVIIEKAKRVNPNSSSDLLKYLKNINFNSDSIDYLQVVPFNGLDINTIIAESNNDCIESKFDFINKAFPGGGYNRGQMVIVCCPPGTGKTLFAMEEILSMALKGYKCLYYAAGDINQKDFLIRMGAQYLGVSFYDAALHLKDTYDYLSNALKDRLDICITPANTVSAREFVDFVKTNPKNYDVIVCDYDSNLKMNDSENSMYSDYGEMYATFSELTIDPNQNKLLFVLAQPKVNSWGDPIINLQDIGESSRKQHTADVIITKGREINCPNHVATMKIVKNRRGETDVTAYTIRLNNGRTKVLPKGLYESLKQEREKINYSEPDIDLMIQKFMSSLPSRTNMNSNPVMNNPVMNNNNNNSNINLNNTPFKN